MGSQVGGQSLGRFLHELSALRGNMSHYYPAIVVRAMDPGIARRFSLTDHGPLVKVHGRGTKDLLGAYVLVFHDPVSRTSYLAETRGNANLKREHRAVTGVLPVFTKVDFNTERDGYLERDGMGWYCPSTPFPDDPEVCALKDEVMSHVNSGLFKECILAFYLIVSKIKEVRGKCQGEDHCRVHSFLGRLVHEAAMKVLSSGHTVLAWGFLGQGVQLAKGCPFVSSKCLAAWFFWTQYSKVFPGREEEQLLAFEKYLHQIREYAKLARNWEDAVNAMQHEYNVGKFLIKNPHPGYTLKGIQHINVMTDVAERLKGTFDACHVVNDLLILGYMLTHFEVRTKIYLMRVREEILSQAAWGIIPNENRVQISFKGIKVLPSNITGKNSISCKAEYISNGLRLEAVRLVRTGVKDPRRKRNRVPGNEVVELGEEYQEAEATVLPIPKALDAPVNVKDGPGNPRGSEDMGAKCQFKMGRNPHNGNWSKEKRKGRNGQGESGPRK